MNSQNTVEQLKEQLWHAIVVTHDAPASEVLDAILPVFAAELRRLASDCDDRLYGAMEPQAWTEVVAIAQALRARADELDPGSPAAAEEN